MTDAGRLLLRFAVTFVVVAADVLASGPTAWKVAALAVFAFLLFSPWLVALARRYWHRRRARRGERTSPKPAKETIDMKLRKRGASTRRPPADVLIEVRFGKRSFFTLRSRPASGWTTVHLPAESAIELLHARGWRRDHEEKWVNPATGDTAERAQALRAALLSECRTLDGQQP